MNINEHISHIQSVINKGNPSDDRRVSDEHIYHLMNVYRARLIWEKQNKFYKLSPFNYQYIHCIPLEEAELNECECYKTGCVVLKSKYILPNILSYRNNMLIKITLLDGTPVSQSSIAKVKYRKYKKTNKDSFVWFIHDKKLVIIGDNRLKTVAVSAIFEDPSKLAELSECDSEGVNTGFKCFDIMNEEYPIDSEMVSAMYQMILNDLGMLYKYPQDDENNAKSTEITNDKE